MQSTLRKSTFNTILGLAVMLGAAAMLAPAPALAQCSGDNPGDPCFAGVSDILAGQREMLADDDLILHVWQQESASAASVDDWTLKTGNFNISLPTGPSQALNNCATPSGVAPTTGAIGRLFWTANDVLISVGPSSDCTQYLITVTDPVTPANDSTTPLGLVAPPHPITMKLADFDLDGFQDIFFLGPNEAQVYTAKCTGDPNAACSSSEGPSDGLIAGEPLTLPQTASASPPEAGDFNRDGIMDVVWGIALSTTPSPGSSGFQFASVCPAAGTTVFDTAIACVNPYQIVPAADPVDNLLSTVYLSMTAGNFTGAVDSMNGRAYTQLLFTGATSIDGPSTVYAFSDFDANLVPGLTKATGAVFDDLRPDDGDDRKIQTLLASGRLDWSGQQDKAVFASTRTASCCDWRGFISVLTFDENLNATMDTKDVPEKNSNGNPQKTRIFGLAVGRFDPAKEPNGDTDFNQGFALLVDRGTKGTKSDEHTWVYLWGEKVYTGTAQDGDTATITLAKGESATNNFYKGMSITITGGTLSGQTRTITAYDGSSKTATVDPAWDADSNSNAPDHTSEYNVWAMFFVPDDKPAQQMKIEDSAGKNIRYYDNGYYQVSALQAGDLQGRSLLLGAPEKTTVDLHIQPDTVLGLPPMHVDFINLSPGATPPTAPQVLNVTVFPDTFNTVYDFDDTSGTQASSTSSTSYTAAAKESEEAKVTYGIPDEDSVSVDLKESATQTHESNVSNSYNTYSSTSYSFITHTVDDDLVMYTSQTMNLYSYPVIGQTVCPSDSPNCPDDCSPGTSSCPKVPLHIQYSGPDTISHHGPIKAAQAEWFQPPHEPFNLFSYPGNLTLLEAAAPQLPDLLTPANEVWASQTGESASITWTEGGGSSQSSGSVSTHSFDTSVSVSGNASFDGVGASASASLDYNQSSSMSTLNTSSQTFAASTGVTFNHGIASGCPACGSAFAYAGQSFIFGQNAPDGTIQDDLVPTLNDSDGEPVPADVQSSGYLQVAHVADMLSTESGDWWKQAYTVPDVALNHPQRWSQKQPGANNDQQVAFNCPIGYTSAFDSPAQDPENPNEGPGSCTYTGATPTPSNVDTAPFYQMKGLFVNPGASTDDQPTGPMITQATYGDTLTFWTRVYNYSLASMPAGTEVSVRFYAQPWDNMGGQFAAGSGTYGFAKALFIGEDVLGPIPPFCGGPGSTEPCADPNAPRNWVLARMQWDTSSLPIPAADTYYKFWVVVWMDDGDPDKPASEIAGHGLTGFPPESPDSLAEIPIETYSNNLGFYNGVFLLALSDSSESSVAGISARSLAIDRVEVSPPTVLLRDQVASVKVHHRAGGGRSDNVLALIYEGDPEAGGELLDMDIIPRVPEDSPFVVRFLYQPNACGPQTLFLRAIPRGGVQTAEAMRDIYVTLDPVAQTRVLIERVESLGLKQGLERSLLAKLVAAKRSFGRGNQRTGLNQLHAFSNQLRAQGGKKVPSADAIWMIARVADLESCL